MIDWATTPLSSPPLLKRVTDDEIWLKLLSGQTKVAEEWQISHLSGGALSQSGHRGIPKDCRSPEPRRFLQKYTPLRNVKAELLHQRKI